MAILRSGARPWHIAGLLVLEALTLALAGIGAGLGLLYAGIALTQVTCRPTMASTCRWLGRAPMNGRCWRSSWVPRC